MKLICGWLSQGVSHEVCLVKSRTDLELAELITSASVCACVGECVCVCACVGEWGRKRDRGTKSDRQLHIFLQGWKNCRNVSQALGLAALMTDRILFIKSSLKIWELRIFRTICQSPMGPRFSGRVYSNGKNNLQSMRTSVCERVSVSVPKRARQREREKVALSRKKQELKAIRFFSQENSDNFSR